MHSPKLAELHADSPDQLLDVLFTPEVKPLYRSAAKRVLDVIGAVILLILAAPLMLLVAMIIRLDGGPALFAHRRVGADGRPFPCLKFRSMRTDSKAMLERHLAENPEARAEWAATFKLKNDPRITPIGRFLRKSSLDELPQLFNVLVGQMSLVGPRPIVRDEIPFYQAKFDLYARCRPGLTGLWQISGRSDVSYDERVRLDVEYVSKWSLALDIAIIVRTPLVMLFSRGAY